MCVCAGERDREELGRGPGGPQGVVVGGIHRSLLPLSDNSAVIQARGGMGSGGLVMKHRGL